MKIETLNLLISLIKEFPLKEIRSKIEYVAAYRIRERILDSLARKILEKHRSALVLYLDIISCLIQDYEVQDNLERGVF